MELVDIDEYENYKFDKKTNKIFNVKTNDYITNRLNGKYYFVNLYKNGIPKSFRLNFFILKYNKDDNFVDIDEYENYKFDKQLNQVINTDTGKYLKNCLHGNGYYSLGLIKNKKIKQFLLHRLVYQSHNPLIDIKNHDIDHINQKKTDNDINNLRIATHSQNACNIKRKDNKSTGIKNIRKIKSNSFQVQIMKDGKIYSKTFKTLDEAISHRDLKLTELHGEFACF